MSSAIVNAMPIVEWRTSAKSIVRGVRRQLCASAPRHVRKQLEELAARLPSVTGSRARNAWANELDSMVDHIPCVHAAAGRYLAPKFRQAARGLNAMARKTEKLRMQMAKVNVKSARQGGSGRPQKGAGALLLPDVR